MDVEVLKSYLVDLGFEVDQSSLRKFDQALKEAAYAISSRTSGIVADVAKWQTAIVGAFASVATGALAMADNVVMADQKYRLLGLRMHMSTEAARKLALGMDVLGASMEEISWDPELNRNFLQLAEDQDVMTRKLGAGFEDNLRSLRDIRLEFNRLKVALTEYLPMMLVNGLFEKFGLTLADVHDKLDGFANSIRDNLPAISAQVGDVLVPILQDAWDVLKGVGAAFAAVATAFTNFVGALTGDTSIESATFDFRNFGKAVVYVADVLADIANLIDNIVERTAHLASGVSAIFSGNWKLANSEGNAMFAALPQLEELRRNGRGSIGGGSIADRIRSAAAAAGLDPNLALAVGMQESGLRQYDSRGNVLGTSGSSAKGIFQLTRAAAADQHVDPNDPNQNIAGGISMLAGLMSHYRGSQAAALAAYYWGSGNVDRALRTHEAIPPDVLNYVRGVEAKEGQSVSIGDISIQIMQPGASPEDVRRGTQQGVLDALNKQKLQQQRTIAQAGFAG